MYRIMVLILAVLFLAGCDTATTRPENTTTYEVIGATVKDVRFQPSNSYVTACRFTAIMDDGEERTFYPTWSEDVDKCVLFRESDRINISLEKRGIRKLYYWEAHYYGEEIPPPK